MIQKPKLLSLRQELITSSPKVTVVSKEGVSINVSLALLSLHSTTMPSLLATLPCAQEPVSLSLPSCSLSTLTSLLDLLNRGWTEETVTNVNQLTDIANCLGINMENFYYGSRVNAITDLVMEKTKDVIKDNTVKKDKMVKENNGNDIIRKGFIEEKQKSCTLENKLQNLESITKSSNKIKIENETDITDNTDSIRNEVKSQEFPPNGTDNKVFVDPIQTMTMKAPKTPLKFGNNFIKPRAKTPLKTMTTPMKPARTPRKIKETSVQHMPTPFKTTKTPVKNTLNFNKPISKTPIKPITKKPGPTPKKPGPTPRKPGPTPKKNSQLPINEVETKKVVDEVGLITDDTNNTTESTEKQKEEAERRSDTNFSIRDLINDYITNKDKESNDSSKQSNEDNIDISDAVDNGTKCYFCEFVDPSIARMKIHMCHSHFATDIKEKCSYLIEDGTTCVLCRAKLSSKSSLLLHIATTHGKLNEILESKGFPKLIIKAKPLRIAATPTKSKGNSSVENHTINNKTIDNRVENKCYECDYVGSSVAVLKQHMVVHFFRELKSESEPFVGEKNTCKLCNEVKKCHRTLIVHIGTRHDKLNDILASKGYPRLELKEGKRGPKPISLGKTSYDNKGLLMFVAGNTCLICGKVFKNDNEGLEHVKANHEDNILKAESKSKLKPPPEIKNVFMCEMCPKEFDLSTDIRRHMADIHFYNDLKVRYETAYCKDPQGSNLVCLICNKTFGQDRAIVRHLGIVHNKLEDLFVEKGLTFNYQTKDMPDTSIKKEVDGIEDSSLDKEDPLETKQTETSLEESSATEQSVEGLFNAMDSILDNIKKNKNS